MSATPADQPATTSQSNPIEYWFDQCAKDRREVEVTILARKLFARWMQNWDLIEEDSRLCLEKAAKYRAKVAFTAAERFYAVMDERRKPKS